MNEGIVGKKPMVMEKGDIFWDNKPLAYCENRVHLPMVWI